MLDYAAADEFFREARAAGFTKPVNGYGGPTVTGLHDGYMIGETGRAWEKKTGKPFGELLKVVWTDVYAHAREQNWPTVQHSFVDETRVAEEARRQVELMRAYREHAPFVYTGGSYSVHWDSKDPLELAMQDLFKTMSWSALNLHTQTDLDRAKEFGRDLLVYNQGRSRFAFGAYQWAEMRKGVRGRLEWHLLALHGYQFFDLDGREPDTALINWGRDGIIPTIRLPWCREGADDFRYAVALWNRAQAAKDTPAGREAIDWLDGVSKTIGVGQRTRPDGFMDDDVFRNQCITRLARLRGAAD